MEHTKLDRFMGGGTSHHTPKPSSLCRVPPKPPLEMVRRKREKKRRKKRRRRSWRRRWATLMFFFAGRGREKRKGRQRHLRYVHVCGTCNTFTIATSRHQAKFSDPQ